jgi:hypothetical protein
MTKNFPESGPTQDVRIFPDRLYDEVVDLPYVASVGLVEVFTPVRQCEMFGNRG